MTREELLNIICPTENIVKCCSGDCSFNCDDCNATMEHILDIYEYWIRADVIDECIEMLKHDCFVSGTASKVLIHHFEQLKEKNK